METDSVTCPQKSESQDECSSEGKFHFTDDRETAMQDMKKKDKEAISGLEKTKTPDSSFSPQPHNHPISSPADGVIEATMEDLNSTVENDPNGDQEWPQVPGLEEDIQPERNECQAIEIQDEVKENTETREHAQTSVHDTEGEEPVTMTPVDKGSPQIPNVANEEGHELESHGDSDSIVFLSENSEEQNIDCKPVDSATTRDQWVRRDSRDEPSNLTYSRSSSKCLLSETEHSSSTQSESTTDPVVNAENIQQGELEVNNPSSLNENEVVQQVCGADPPLETVAGEPTNPEQANSACISTEVKEPLIMPQGRRNSKREEREGGETGEERKQTVCFTETGGTGGKQLGEVKDQRQERENNGQRAESQSNTKPHLGEGKVNRMQVYHFDDSQSDSGVSADFSPNSTTDVLEGHDNEAPQPSESPPNETPIEREIRLTMKREQSLRRSRGLCDTTDRTNEFVEIPLRRPILSQDPQIRHNPSHGKDRQFAGKKMQKEISAETEREKVLVELGRLPGFYDKGTEVQLQEKKQLFESFQEPKESVATRSASNSTAESAAGIQEVDSAADVKQRLMQFSQNSPTPPATAQYGGTNGNPPAARGPGLSEGIKGQIIIIESNAIPTTVGGPNGGYKTTSWTDGGSVKEMNSAGVRASSDEPVRARQSPNLEGIEDEDLSLVKENPFFKLRSSMSLQSQVELDIKEAKKREQELQRQRNSLYGGTAMYTDEGSGTGMDLRTEIRVKEERGTSSQEIPPPQWTNLTPAGRQSETLTTTTSVRQSTGKLDLTWPPPQSDEDQRQLSETTVTIPRQRNPLLERWESGIVNDWD
ncbi:mitotic interactor and substrate of PLK1-like [Sinocyclocheilus anshuiensis]|uniref:mitotic interactor and substrate of PLK1-like n=1 Tax=Sinocyclocheilus anshuiensis TaxID=1608454 RepID=UPI0007BAB35A|nr:PREDICTED: mitotic interactor and substrate of PLK1-like [Sinocyclocheilus anshuiensis]